ncbi:hypothetical protein F3Y22_tig00110388pilonHSYRG00060 [Hibiscus syriacus]|uniref:Uncharacterized protein n=1 Tax=Hibiscus syriacus TaxID=106335 RepID=A0A6A3ATJ7_HIBSY|nr:hypothetical protein F3Y22_tig00110388pilonHSYRG00060 [Hibiscus syriacus]
MLVHYNKTLCISCNLPAYKRNLEVQLLTLTSSFSKSATQSSIHALVVPSAIITFIRSVPLHPIQFPITLFIPDTQCFFSEKGHLLVLGVGITRVKYGCNYIVHVSCALENPRFFDVVERESQCEELNGNSAKSMQSSINRVVEFGEDGNSAKSMQSSINRVVEFGEDGEATKIEHFSHEECHFCLHKNCAELPRVNRLWFRRSTAAVVSKSIIYCLLCSRFCSGFFYAFVDFLYVCLRCAKVPDVIEFQGHNTSCFMIPNAARSDAMVVATTPGTGVDSDVESAVLLWISNAYCYHFLFFTNLINTSSTLPIMTIIIIQNIVIVTYVKEKEIQSSSIIIVQSVILLLIPFVFLENLLFSRMGSHYLKIFLKFFTDIIMIFGFLRRLRTTLTARPVVNVAEKKFSGKFFKELKSHYSRQLPLDAKIP